MQPEAASNVKELSELKQEGFTMRKFNTAIVGAAAAALLLAAPVSATPLAGATSNTASHVVTGANGAANVIQIKTRAERRAERRANRRAERRADRRRLRGHRGHRNKRRGYRRHSDGWWYPLAAFGAIAAGSAIANSADRGSRHEEWCEERYRSYRVWDNTFQPYNGPRKECNSPYG